MMFWPLMPCASGTAMVAERPGPRMVETRVAPCLAGTYGLQPKIKILKYGFLKIGIPQNSVVYYYKWFIMNDLGVCYFEKHPNAPAVAPSWLERAAMQQANSTSC